MTQRAKVTVQSEQYILQIRTSLQKERGNNGEMYVYVVIRDGEMVGQGRIYLGDVRFVGGVVSGVQLAADTFLCLHIYIWG